MSPRYLETLRVPLVGGRMFNRQERADSGVTGRVAVINKYMAEKFWKTPQDALGKRFRFGSATDTSRSWITVIGVAADIKENELAQQPDLQGYMPYRQGGWNSAAIVVRTRGEPIRATSTVLAALRQSDPLLPAYRVSSMDANIGLVGALIVTRFLRTMFFGLSPFDPVSFIGVSLVLSAIALLARYVPARRPARVDPVEALRYD